MRKNLYLSELGISKHIYAGNFVTEKKDIECINDINMDLITEIFLT